MHRGNRRRRCSLSDAAADRRRDVQSSGERWWPSTYAMHLCTPSARRAAKHLRHPLNCVYVPGLALLHILARATTRRPASLQHPIQPCFLSSLPHLYPTALPLSCVPSVSCARSPAGRESAAAPDTALTPQHPAIRRALWPSRGRELSLLLPCRLAQAPRMRTKS